ncbi:MAG: hypothetical protein IMZ53_15365 [Thermoplasmata archaeon]|nr:hypothetical protein [Thermoplasmata archaeon]
MTPKAINFYTTTWLCSIMICMIIEGSWFGSAGHGEQTIIQNLTSMNALNIGDIVGIGSFLVNFFEGILRILLWDYSFYYGGYEVIRWVMVVIFTPAAIWGIGSFFATVFANFLRVG